MASGRTIDIAALVATIADTEPSESIVPQRHRSLLRAKIDAMLAVAERLTLRGSIGEGGRGLIRAAEQPGLRREVAVKTVRGTRTDEAIAELLQEALITGSLEHPNIVPVHYIGVDELGDPFIVLKKIEGEPWDRSLGGGGDLERDLRVLLEVIDAVRFAHSRGIIHRDLKPANVMVGRFGEVYVLDWGLAVSVGDESGLVPSAADQSGVAGTLGYMAPEMLESRGLSERTDVYLLGAMLYEIATGRPPHRGTTLVELVEAVQRSQPDVDGVPAELAAIIGKAMSRDPADRFASADELKEAIELLLIHRDATRLVDATGDRLGALVDAVAAGAGRDHLYNLFAECRFGFGEALRTWSGAEGARRGLERAVRIMVEWELGRGEPTAAERVLAELDAPPGDLRDRVSAQLARQREKLESLEKLEVDLDLRTDSRRRLLGIAIVATVGVGALVGLPLVATTVVTAPTWTQLIAIAAAILGIFAIAAVVLRRAVMSSRPNRLYTMSTFAVLIATLVAFAGLAGAGVEPEVARLVHPPLWLSMSAMLMVAVDRRMWPSPVAMSGLGLAMPWVSWRASWFALGAALLLLAANIVWVTTRRARERAGRP